MNVLLTVLIAVATPSHSAGSPPTQVDKLVEFFRRSDEYRQCLVLDRSRLREPRDSFFAEGGMSAENLDLMLADRQDRLLKRLIEQGKGNEILEALRRVRYERVDEGRCADFDPSYSRTLTPLEDLEATAGIEPSFFMRRSRKQAPR